MSIAVDHRWKLRWTLQDDVEHLEVRWSDRYVEVGMPTSKYTYMPNFIEIEGTFWTDVRTYVRTDGQTDGHLRPALLGRLCRRVDLKIVFYSTVDMCQISLPISHSPLLLPSLSLHFPPVERSLKTI